METVSRSEGDALKSTRFLANGDVLSRVYLAFAERFDAVVGRCTRLATHRGTRTAPFTFQIYTFVELFLPSMAYGFKGNEVAGTKKSNIYSRLEGLIADGTR